MAEFAYLEIRKELAESDLRIHVLEEELPAWAHLLLVRGQVAEGLNGERLAKAEAALVEERAKVAALEEQAEAAMQEERAKVATLEERHMEASDRASKAEAELDGQARTSVALRGNAALDGSRLAEAELKVCELREELARHSTTRRTSPEEVEFEFKELNVEQHYFEEILREAGTAEGKSEDELVRLVLEVQRPRSNYSTYVRIW